MLKKIWVVLVWSVPACLTALVIYQATCHHLGLDQFGSPGIDRPAQPPSGVQKERIDKWRSLEFVSLTADVNLRELVGAFNFRLEEPLNAVESEALTNAVDSFIEAFHDGTFEAYTKFRIPVNRFRFADGVNSFIQKKLLLSAEAIEKDPGAAWRKYWDQTAGVRYTNYWNGIAVTNCEVLVENSSIPTNDLMHSLTDHSAAFTLDSIKTLAPFAVRLANPAPSDKVSQFLKGKFSPETSTLLAQYVNVKSFEPTQKALLKDLNDIIQSGPVYTPERFAGVKLADETLMLLKRNPQGQELVRLNRLLLTDAYPKILLPYTPVENVGFAWRQPCLLLEPSRAELVKADGSVKLATIRMLCKPRDEDPVYPVFLRLYWSPGDQKWLPEQLIAACARRDRRFDLFF